MFTLNKLNCSQQLSSAKQKGSQFHHELRQKYIENYKAKARRQNQVVININAMLQNLPQQLEQAINWCKRVLSEYSKSKQYRFCYLNIIDLFKLVKKFPCLETVQLLHSIAHRITDEATDELYQYDVTGLLHSLIQNPQKMIPRVIMSKFSSQQQQHQINMLMQIRKKAMLTIACLCKQSVRARNFNVLSHNSFLTIQKAHNRYRLQVEAEFIECLCSFVKFPILSEAYSQQFLRIVKNLCLIFYNNLEQLSFEQVVLVTKSLTNVVKSKQKWVMDLIQENCQYDLLQKVIKMYKACRYASQNSDKDKTKQLGQIIHNLNIFMINYIQVTINQHIDWENFMTQWFHILLHRSSYFQFAKRDICFIFNNIICEAEEPDSSYHLLRSMIFQHKCVQVFSKVLQTQTSEDLLQQVSYCINSLFFRKNVELFAQEVIASNLIGNCMQAITRNLYAVNDDTKSSLLQGLNQMLDKTQNKQVKARFAYQIKCYQNKIMQICMLPSLKKLDFGQIADKLIEKCADL